MLFWRKDFCNRRLKFFSKLILFHIELTSFFSSLEKTYFQSNFSPQNLPLNHSEIFDQIIFFVKSEQQRSEPIYKQLKQSGNRQKTSIVSCFALQSSYYTAQKLFHYFLF